ncbi:hypothetical protein GCM10023151_18320 [Kangiella marina]|uniref:Virulence factor membrane-bound polymerase C-terminal domain-containing protein n=2 Tax=Kangiella marina TaxID=1079178 RepID=A0ABP8IME1_9GAMM
MLLGGLASLIFMSTFFNSEVKDFSKTHNRELIYSTALNAIEEKPLFGHGLGSFEKVYLIGLENNLNNEVVKASTPRAENLSHPHNELLYWGVQGGLISILGLVIILVGLLLPAFTGKKKAFAGVALLTPIGLHTLVELPFYISGAHLLLAILLFFYITSSANELKVFEFNVSPTISKFGRGFAGVVGAGVAVALLLNIYSLYQAVVFEKALNRTEQQLKKSIVHIGWRPEYNSLLLKHRANIAVESGEKQPVIDFLQWLEEQNQISPRLQYFFNLYYSYQILGEKEKAEDVKLQIECYYTGVRTADEWLKSH